MDKFDDSVVNKLGFLNDSHDFGTMSPLRALQTVQRIEEVWYSLAGSSLHRGWSCTGYETYLGKGKFKSDPIQEFIIRPSGHWCRMEGLRKGFFTIAPVISIHLP